MQTQEEIMSEYVLDQLSELGLTMSDDFDVRFSRGGSGKRLTVAIFVPEDRVDVVSEVLDSYSSELSEDFSYSFPGIKAVYRVCSDSDEAEDTDASLDPEYDISAGFVEVSELSGDYDDSDEDDPAQQYQEEGLFVRFLDETDPQEVCAAFMFGDDEGEDTYE